MMRDSFIESVIDVQANEEEETMIHREFDGLEAVQADNESASASENGGDD